MKTQRMGVICVLVAICGSGAARAMSVDEALGRLQTYQLGRDNEVVDTIRDAAVGAHGDAALRTKLATDLAAVLEADTTTDAKRFACRQLALIGAEAQVPALARRLTDPELSQMARYALARIPGEAADRALLDALGRTEGANQLGIINTLGNRQCEAAVQPLGELLRAQDMTVAAEAAKALGRIHSSAALRALQQALEDPQGADLAVIADACLDAVEQRGSQSEIGTMCVTLADANVPSHVRGAALLGYTQASGRADGVLSSLKGSDRQMQDAAAQAAVSVAGPQEIRVLAAALPHLPVRAQVLLLYALAKRGDRAALDAATNACASADAGVRIAALEALAVLGDATSVPVLLDAASAGTPEQQAQARRSLAALRAENVNDALLGRVVAGADDRQKAEIAGVLTARDAVEAVPTLFAMSRSGNRQVRFAAVAGLQELAGPEHIPALVDLLAATDAGDRRRAAQMLVAVARRCHAQKRIAQELIAKQGAAQDLEVRRTLLLILGDLGDGAGLPVLRQALDDGAESIRRAALAALSGWPDGTPLVDLLRVAKEGGDPASRVLALRGCIDVLGRARALPPREKVHYYQAALGLAPDAAERKRVFAGLATLKTVEAMELAAFCVQDDQVKEEAALAAVTIAQNIYGGNAATVKAALERVLAANVRSATREEAQKIVEELEAAQSYLTKWEVAGPYLATGKNYSQLFDTPFDPERPKAKVEWRPMPVSTNGPHPAYCDLLKELGGGEQRVAYLRTRIEVEEARPVVLEIFSDDGVKVWLNGRVVHANNVARPIPVEPDRATVMLDKGVNRLMLKVTQNNQPWGAIVRVRDVKPAPPKIGDGFKLHVINADSRFEAAGALDVNRDGKLDIFCGGFWYEAPDWKRHFVREVKEEGDYYYDFANLPIDVDGDGWVDIANAAWHNKMVFWERNPGKAEGPWEVFPIDTPGNMETALAVDINGDGQPDVLPNIMTAAAWYEFHRDASAPGGARWEKHELPKEAAGHGIGAGDINKDGRCDVVAPKGWLEQTATGWAWRPEFELGSTSVPILVHDVDGDADSDIVWGLGHDYGIYWLEQKTADGPRTWVKHLIDKSWSQPHFMVMADLDSDGNAELVTGKRYHAHNGHDPGGNDPVCIYYYKFRAGTRGWTRHLIHEGGRVAFGINTAVVDMDGDGDLDIVAPGKSGLYLLENLIK
jgi:HEAT repeat protein